MTDAELSFSMIVCINIIKTHIKGYINTLITVTKNRSGLYSLRHGQNADKYSAKWLSNKHLR